MTYAPLDERENDITSMAHVLEEDDSQPAQRLGQRLSVVLARAVSPGGQAHVGLTEEGVDALVVALRQVDDRVDFLLGARPSRSGQRIRSSARWWWCRILLSRLMWPVTTFARSSSLCETDWTRPGSKANSRRKRVVDGVHVPRIGDGDRMSDMTAP